MHAAIAQSVERIHGKDEVTGSNPVRGSIFFVAMIVIGVGFEMMVMMMREVRENKFKSDFNDN